MTTNQQMFIYAAQEMNFTKAAKRAFVTQQCLSDHIKRLEMTYNVKLFERTPHLRLTHAGELLYASLIEIQRIERHIEHSISEDSYEVEGNISFGIHLERTHLIFPALFSAYHKRYPNVKVSLVSDHTPQLLEYLENGKVDMMLGLDIPPDERYEKELILEEPLYLVATEKYLRKYLPDRVPGTLTLEPEALNHLPLSCTSYTCSVSQRVGQFLTDHSVISHYICEVGDYFTQLMICRNHETAFFCPDSFLIADDSIQSFQAADDDRVLPLTVRGLDGKIRVEIIYSSQRYLPAYTAAFKTMFREQYQSRVNLLKGSVI